MSAAARIANAFSMSDAVWARHANPWSGWTRMPILPVLVLAVWARVWLGWASLLPIAAILAWTWINPRAFPPPVSTGSWMSRAVMGERVWLNARNVPIPPHHASAARLLSLLPVPGLAATIWGLVVLNPWAAGLGCALTVLPKLWFLDRMVWLFDDMAPGNPEYQSWIR